VPSELWVREVPARSPANIIEAPWLVNGGHDASLDLGIVGGPQLALSLHDRVMGTDALCPNGTCDRSTLGGAGLGGLLNLVPAARCACRYAGMERWSIWPRFCRRLAVWRERQRPWNRTYLKLIHLAQTIKQYYHAHGHTSIARQSQLRPPRSQMPAQASLLSD
jgi:hypothetical protein